MKLKIKEKGSFKKEKYKLKPSLINLDMNVATPPKHNIIILKIFSLPLIIKKKLYNEEMPGSLRTNFRGSQLLKSLAFNKMNDIINGSTRLRQNNKYKDKYS